MDEQEREPIYVNELELALLSVGLELVKSHSLFPDYEDEQRELLGRLYGLMVL